MVYTSVHLEIYLEIKMEENKSSCYAKLSVCNLAMALGLVWGISMFFLGLVDMTFHLGTPIVSALGSLYLGYKATFVGSLIGLAWGFLDGYIGGLFIALFYNWCRCCCPCPMCRKARCCGKCNCDPGRCHCEPGKCNCQPGKCNCDPSKCKP